MNKVIANDLARLVIEDSDFENLSSKIDSYCPFEALNVARHEIRHSAFLENLLNPHGPHKAGDVFLKSLLETCCTETGDDELRLKLHFADLSNVDIRREWQNIDLMIRIPKSASFTEELIFVIELKVEAGLKEHQPSKYRNKIGASFSEATTKFIILSPDEIKIPDDESEFWTNILFEPLIEGFEETIQQTHLIPDVALMASNYCRMIRRRYMPNVELEEIAAKIWQQHEQVLDYLISQKPDIINDLRDLLEEKTSGNNFQKFLKDLNVYCFEDGQEITILPAHSDRKYLRFHVQGFEKLEVLKSHPEEKKFNCLIIVEIIFDKNKVRAKFCMIEGMDKNRELIFDHLKNEPLISSARQTLPKKWASFELRELLSLDAIDAYDSAKELYQKEFLYAVSQYLLTQIPRFRQALEKINRIYLNQINS